MIPAIKAEEQPVKNWAIQPPAVATHSILLVDGNEDHARLMQMAIHRAFRRRQVGLFTRGSDFWRFLEGQKPPQGLPDLIVMDVDLPDMDGMQLLRRLKKSAHWEPIPVVVFSNLDRPEMVRRALELGAVEYVVKPFHFVEFSAAICRIARQWAGG